MEERAKKSAGAAASQREDDEADKRLEKKAEKMFKYTVELQGLDSGLGTWKAVGAI